MSLRAALSTFTVIPVAAAAGVEARVLLWFPAIGAALGATGGLVAAAVLGLNAAAGFLAAVLAVASVGLLTRGLHLDGLADTADGLGSRLPAAEALDVMRRSDIGPFGVVTVVVVLLTDIASLDVLRGHQWHVCAAFAVAAATGRLAVVHAAARGVPSARPGGFGALVAGSVAPVQVVLQSVCVLGAGAGLAALCSVNPAKWLGAQLAALVVAYGFRLHTTRRFGGVTGDVFGALVELGTAVTLIGIALA
jgi:adenosylcobinamide-GDP ribazoletransferase